MTRLTHSVFYLRILYSMLAEKMHTFKWWHITYPYFQGLLCQKNDSNGLWCSDVATSNFALSPLWQRCESAKLRKRKNESAKMRRWSAKVNVRRNENGRSILVLGVSPSQLCIFALLSSPFLLPSAGFGWLHKTRCTHRTRLRFADLS